MSSELPRVENNAPGRTGAVAGAVSGNSAAGTGFRDTRYGGQGAPAMRYVPALTGIRAVAALMVLLLHTEQNVPAGLAATVPFLDHGHLGVDFFFVLSGFIISHVYLSALARPDWQAIRVFLWHRLIRLYPVHVTILAGLVAMVGLASSAGLSFNVPEAWRPGDLWAHLTLLHAWGVTATATWNAPSWSISAEWFAYLLFPALAPALLLLRRPTAAAIAATAALASMAGIFAAAGWEINSWTGAPALVRVSGEFICGAALFRLTVLLRGSTSAFAVAKPLGLRHPGDLLAMAAFAGYLVGASTGVIDEALVGLLALTILGVANSEGPMARFLGSRPVAWLGEISYSVYMVHFPLLIVLRRVLEAAGYAAWSRPAHLAAFALAIALVIAAAAILFYVVEHPARRRFRDRFGVLAPA